MRKWLAVFIVVWMAIVVTAPQVFALTGGMPTDAAKVQKWSIHDEEGMKPNGRISEKDGSVTWGDVSLKHPSTIPGMATDEDIQALTRGGVPSVSAEQAATFFGRKIGDILFLLQSVVQPLSLIFFIFACMLAVFGHFSKNSAFIYGIWIACTSLLVYVACVYAPEIQLFVLNWMAE